MVDKSAEKARFARVVYGEHFAEVLVGEFVLERFRRSPIYHTLAEDYAKKVNAAHEKAVQESRNGAIEEMIKACEDERVDFEATQHDSDRAYNQAIDDCVERCRALRGNG